MPTENVGHGLNRATGKPCSSVVEFLLTEKEAARALKISQKSVYLLRKSGKLGYVQLGERIFYAPDQLTKLINGHRKEAVDG